ncbi:MAG: cytochrome c [bacterium]
MPRPIIYVLLVLTALTLLPLAFIARSRVTDSQRPRIQVVPDMDSQPKYKTQAPGPLFADGRAMRKHVSGTVAHGELWADDKVALGRHTAGPDTGFVLTSPLPVTSEALARGRHRFDIFCAVCHGRLGDGNGMVHTRAAQLAEGTWTPPANLTADLTAGRPAGFLFDTITNGVRNMPGYGRQIPIEDRWAIVAYLRALQRSSRGSVDDVPSAERSRLE